jgi:hypothetical protein
MEETSTSLEEWRHNSGTGIWFPFFLSQAEDKGPIAEKPQIVNKSKRQSYWKAFSDKNVVV